MASARTATTRTETEHAESDGERVPAQLWPWQALPELAQVDTVCSPRQAAYEVGKLLTLLDFYQTQAVLNDGNQHGNITRTHALFDAIGLRVRDASLQAPRELVQQRIRQEREDWLDRRRSYGFYEAKFAAVYELDRQERYNIEFDFHPETCEEVLSFFTDHLKRTGDFLRAQLDLFSRQLLEFGASVMRGPCPASPYRFVKRCEEVPDSEPLPPDSDRTDSQVHSHCLSLDLMLGQVFQPGELPFDSSWLASLEKQWGELGFPPPLFQEIVGLEWESGNPLSFARRMDQAVQDCLSECEQEQFGKELKAMYLGITPDRRADKVWRGEKSVSLGGNRRYWDLLTRFCSARENYLSTAELRKWVWAGIQVSNDTVRTTICELRTLLKPLGVTIKNVRNVGYRLEELPKPRRVRNTSRAKRGRSPHSRRAAARTARTRLRP
jgi:DNA-binding winged helix-turn-helix (wHTH) protein